MDYNPYNPSTNPSSYPMKWHKFLIYFALWLSALSWIRNGFTFLNGSHYDNEVERNLVYAVFANLKSLDTVMALLSFGVAALAIWTRFSLAGYKQRGPKLLMTLYGVNGIFDLLYTVLASSITGLPFSDLIDASVFIAVIVAVIMIFVNKAYYDNRAALFIY